MATQGVVSFPDPLLSWEPRVQLVRVPNPLLSLYEFQKRETAMLSCPIVLWAQAAKELKILKIYL